MHCVVDNPFLNPNCNSDEHNEYSSLIRIIYIQFKHVLVNHSDVSSRICLETTHRVHNDGLAGIYTLIIVKIKLIVVTITINRCNI